MKRRSKPTLEVLERREVLSSFTWSGGAGNGNWDTGTNWVGGVAPKTGAVDVTFPTTANAQVVTLQADDTGLVFDSFTVQGGVYTLEGPSANAEQMVTLANGASLNVQNGGTLNVCPNRSSGVSVNSLSVFMQGTTTQTGTGTVDLNIDLFFYASSGALQPWHVTQGNLIVNGAADMPNTAMQLDSGTTLTVIEKSGYTVGSLNGSGTVQLGVNTGSAGVTYITIATPQSTTGTFTGVIDGAGGSVIMSGEGTQILGSVNPNQTGEFSIGVSQGTMLVNGTVNAKQVIVIGGTTFGGLGTMTFSQKIIFDSGATFAATINGTGPGQFTKLIDTDVTDANPVTIDGATLSAALGYTPAAGDNNTLISATAGITGQFSNAVNNGTFTVGNVVYTVGSFGSTFSLSLPSKVNTNATHLFISSQPPAEVSQGSAFGLTVEALNNSNAVDPTYSGTVILTASPGGATFNTTAIGGVATFSGLVLSNPGTFTFQATAGGLTATNTNSVTVINPQVVIPTIVSEGVLTTQKHNKKGRAIGKPVFQGFEFTFSTAMGASVGNAANYQVTVPVVKTVKRKRVTIQQPVAVQVSYNPVTDMVSLLVSSQKFKKGGQIIVVCAAPNGIENSTGTFLDGGNQGVAGDNGVFRILPNAKGLVRG